MKVWIHSPFDNLPQEGFRRQRYWRMAEAFAAEGHDVVYWTMDFNHGTKARRRMSAQVPSSVRIEIIGVPAYRRNVSLARIVSHLVYARRLSDRIRALPSPDLVVSATPTLGAAKVLLRFARRVGAKFVLDIQDAWPETFSRLLPRGLGWIAGIAFYPLHRTARLLYRESDLVTGVCERYRELSGRDDYYLAYHGI